jgi:hypothetical protein
MIGTFDFLCHNCGVKSEILKVDNGESKDPVCPICQSADLDRLFTPPRGKTTGVIPGGFANDPLSELYTRPDKDHPAREMKQSYIKMQKLIEKGRTRPVDSREMRMYKDRMACYERKYGEAP